MAEKKLDKPELSECAREIIEKFRKKSEEDSRRMGEEFMRYWKEHGMGSAYTTFGKNHEAVQKFGRLLLEFKDAKEIIINVIGPGIENGVSYEVFELLNQVRLAGIPPERVKVYVTDIRPEVIDAIKKTEVLPVPAVWAKKLKNYFRDFFPEQQGKERNGAIPVAIPEEYRKTLTCLTLDAENMPMPEKADITLALVYYPFMIYQPDNPARSTRKGGYLLSFGGITEEAVKRLDLEEVYNGDYAVYRVRG